MYRKGNRLKNIRIKRQNGNGNREGKFILKSQEISRKIKTLMLTTLAKSEKAKVMNKFT